VSGRKRDQVSKTFHDDNISVMYKLAHCRFQICNLVDHGRGITGTTILDG
jgi:hypothetical protein